MLKEQGCDIITVTDYKSVEPRENLMINYGSLAKDDGDKAFWHVGNPGVIKGYVEYILRVRTQGGG